jgi:hypothetical protein
MKPKHILSLFLLPVFFVLFIATSCTARSGSQASETGTVSEVQLPAGPAWPALALLKTGENPLWFELGPGGPLLIDSPVAATLTPYSPWPHARFITGMEMWEGFLVMAVNRDGFLILGVASEPTELYLYRVADSILWEPYTTESFFIWENKPSVLLYRNDFFSGLSAPPPVSQVYVLSKSSPVPLAASIPAFENFPPPWEAEVVRRGSDGFWYFRMKEKGQANNDIAYFRTEDLANPGTRISIDLWRNSDPRGQDSHGANFDTGAFSLPALPEGFVYSKLVLLGNVLVAAWEEQLDAGIGAAGFMVVALDAN